MQNAGENGAAWFVLGFTADDVIATWQDARLAEESMRAWVAAGKPAAVGILQAAGEGDYFLYWFVDEAAARILDASHVDWRRFIVGQRAAPPQSARPVLKEGAGSA